MAAVPDQQFELPEDRILQKLLNGCYHASFRTSEQHVVQCVVDGEVKAVNAADGLLMVWGLILD